MSVCRYANSWSFIPSSKHKHGKHTHLVGEGTFELYVQYRCSDEYNVQRKRCTCVLLCDVCTIHVVDALLSQPAEQTQYTECQLSCAIYLCSVFCAFSVLMSYDWFRCVFFDRTYFFCSKVISTYGTLHLHKVRIRKHSRLLFIIIVDFFFASLFQFYFLLLFSFCFVSITLFIYSFGQSVNPKCAIVLNHRPVIINLLHYCHRIVSSTTTTTMTRTVCSAWNTIRESHVGPHHTNTSFIYAYVTN